MDYQSPSRDRYGSRSPTPKSRYSRSPSPVRRRRSPTRSPSPTSRRNGRFRSESRSLSRARDARDARGRSESPLRGSTKIVVEKLTKTINEDHLHEIFGQYGPIRDLDMPMNRPSYILYVHEADAEAAIAHMHEAVLDAEARISILDFPRPVSGVVVEVAVAVAVAVVVVAAGLLAVEEELFLAEEAEGAEGDRSIRLRGTGDLDAIALIHIARAPTQDLGLHHLLAAIAARRGHMHPDHDLLRDDEEEEIAMMIMMMIGDAARVMIATVAIVARGVVVGVTAKSEESWLLREDRRLGDRRVFVRG
ncbi:hypothetical protein AAE478_008330 [Parahypoxylon ruwenzoriense]